MTPDVAVPAQIVSGLAGDTCTAKIFWFRPSPIAIFSQPLVRSDVRYNPLSVPASRPPLPSDPRTFTLSLMAGTSTGPIGAGSTVLATAGAGFLPFLATG